MNTTRFFLFSDQELAALERGLDLAHQKSLKVRREAPGATLAEKEDRVTPFTPLLEELEAEVKGREG